jgi:uncharacterized glyoxalase superfamily protein PhnB
MQLSNYLFFTTTCEQALQFYTECGLGQVVDMLRIGENRRVWGAVDVQLYVPAGITLRHACPTIMPLSLISATSATYQLDFSASG